MPTLAKIKFAYGVKFDQEKRQRLKELCFEAPFNVDSTEETLWADVIMLVEDAMQFGMFEVKEILPYHILTRISDFGMRQTAGPVNETCKVNVAGLGLLTVDTVKLRQDHCTDALQEDLDNGWKIIAICVQPDQRRPDYILGKTTKLE